MGRLIDSIEKGTFINVGWDRHPAYYEFCQFGNKVDEEIHKLPEVWFKNAEINIEWIDKNKDRVIGSVYDLPSYKDKAIVFVGASPILKKTWHYLKGLDNRFIIVAVNSSARYLLNRGIIPHYVVCIDGHPSKYWDLSLGKRGEKVIGIFSPYVTPEALRQFRGKFYMIPYTHKGRKYKSITDKVRGRWGKGISSGGNAFNAAVSSFANCTDARIMLFVGNELSFKRKYYVHGKSGNDEIPHYYTKDVKGKRVRTLSALWTYKIWLEANIEAISPPYVCYNCSEGILGIGPDGNLLPFLKQMDLGDAIAEVKDAFDFENKSWDEKSKRIYNTLYQQDWDKERQYTRGNVSHEIWDFVKKEIPLFKKGLDVGCGKAYGIRDMKQQGYDVYGLDIASSLQLFWNDLGIADRCYLASAHKMPFKDNEFDMMVCTETLEHIPPASVDDVLKEIYRVGSDKFLFTMSRFEDFTNGVLLHLTVRSPQWWEAKLEQHGFKIAYSFDRLNPEEQEKQRSSFIYAVKDKIPYENKKKKLTISDTEFPICVVFGKGSRSWKESQYAD